MISNNEEALLTKVAFSQNIFGISNKFESSATTPTYQSRISIKEGAQDYCFTLNKDINIENLKDNHGRPLSELFFTNIWKGYFGWTYGGPASSLGQNNQLYLKRGWDFNLPMVNQLVVIPPPVSPNDSVLIPFPQAWWTNAFSSAQRQNQSTQGAPGINNLTFSTYEKRNQTFYYLNDLNENDYIDGDFCEWNESEQKERVISKVVHKFYFNPSSFNFLPRVNAVLADQTISAMTMPIGDLSPWEENPYGFYYTPHHSMKIREFSEYLETAGNDTANIPNYAFYSSSNRLFFWREPYPIGFKDNLNRGVDYPFMNGAHYPTTSFTLKLFPEGNLFPYNQTVSVDSPISDNCE